MAPNHAVLVLLMLWDSLTSCNCLALCATLFRRTPDHISAVLECLETASAVGASRDAQASLSLPSLPSSEFAGQVLRGHKAEDVG